MWSGVRCVRCVPCVVVVVVVVEREENDKVQGKGLDGREGNCQSGREGGDNKVLREVLQKEGKERLVQGKNRLRITDSADGKR